MKATRSSHLTFFTLFSNTLQNIGIYPQKSAAHDCASPRKLFLLGNRLGLGLLVLSLLSLYSHASLASQLSKFTPHLPAVEASVFYGDSAKKAPKLAAASGNSSSFMPPPLTVLTEEDEEAGLSKRFLTLAQAQPKPRDRKLATAMSKPSRGLSALRGNLSLLMIPVRESYISSRFGWRNGRPHEGTDFAAPLGSPIYASADGLVVSSGWTGGYGNMVIIDHGNGLKTRYGHCSKVLVPAGITVKRGQLIGRVGNTGHSTGPHLHYEVLANGVARNPEAFLR